MVPHAARAMNLALVGFLLFYAALVSSYTSTYSMSTNSKTPFNLELPLKFCSYSKTACCNSTQDLQSQKQLQYLNVSNAACACLLKSILFAICDPLSAEMFKSNLGSRNVPVFSNFMDLAASHQSKSSASYDFGAELWDVCQNLSICISSLRDQWKSMASFCEAFGGSANRTTCFSGEPSSFNQTEALQSREGLCLEKLENGAYLSMVPHPDGSNRVFLANQQGVVWLATIPDDDSSNILEIDKSKPFINISDSVVHDTESGLMGMAFHPNFAQNGRFFLSFTCDKTKQLGCSGRCSCNTEVNCDPSKLSSDDGAWACQYHSVIAEFNANSTASEFSMERSADPFEVRRILTIGLPSKSGHAGQIIFGPTDGYLYVTMGDGWRQDDPYSFAQNKKSLLGKIMRLDIDHMPSVAEIHSQGLWGNYSIPRDNPYTDDEELGPEIWARGFRNPWRCSFDSERPSYFLCGDCGQDKYEEIDIITKGGNYGWHVYEGPFRLHPATSSEGNISKSSINLIFPVMGYSHSETDNDIGSASITGGYFYRSATDPCMYGRYLYMDLYAGAIWTGLENPENSGNFTTTKIFYKCANDSPIQCNLVEGNSLPALGYVFSLAEDNKKDVYILTSTGVYRIARPSRCNYRCSKETRAAAVIPATDASSFIFGHPSKKWRNLSLFLMSFVSGMLHVIIF